MQDKVSDTDAALAAKTTGTYIPGPLEAPVFTPPAPPVPPSKEPEEY